MEVESIFSHGNARGVSPPDFSPTTWDRYFAHKKTITLEPEGNKFCVYQTGGDKGVPIILLHGAGHSGLSWAMAARFLSDYTECRVFAIDLRGHGETITVKDSDLSVETMTS